jgi:hypothetical protein
MATNKLKAKQIELAKPSEKPYKLTDGDGMFLLVDTKGGRYWRLNYRFAEKQKTLALGPYPDVSSKRPGGPRRGAQGHPRGHRPGEQRKVGKITRNTARPSASRPWRVNGTANCRQLDGEHRQAEYPRPGA